jgi:SOS regulatory protein LexA
MLTKRQKEILDFVTAYSESHGYSPSLEEIGAEFGLSSISTVHYHLDKLKKSGYLEKETSKPRSISLSKQEMVQVPVLGTIAAGAPIEAITDREDTVAVSRNNIPKSAEVYALKVKGDSMIDEDIFDGDIVIVQHQPTAEDGEKVVALIDKSEATLKKIYREKGRIRLQPANPRLLPIYVDPENLLIQGKVLTVVKTAERIKVGPVFSTPLITKTKEPDQHSLFELPKRAKFPSTRFQGSKTKLVERIWECIKELDFESSLDLFGGTGSVGYMLKTKGKQVYYNDYLRFNYLTGLGLIENSKENLNDKDLDFVLSRHSNIEYPNFIEKTFQDIYFTDEENRWLDVISTNIRQIKNKYKQALAYFALFQACTIKRPYNLFHRKNLYVRFADVERSFGNKTTWDKSFEEHFLTFVKEVNDAVFDNKQENKAFNQDAFDLNIKADLIYIDTPYISKKGVGVDYIDFYHFLEGLSDYQNWYKHIDFDSKHRKFKNKKSVWSDKNKITEAFDKLFAKYKDSILVVSYRSDGIPSPEELQNLMKKYKKNVYEAFRSEYKYALSKNGDSKEILLIGR